MILEQRPFIANKTITQNTKVIKVKANRVFEAPTNANDEVKSSSQSNEKERKLLQFRITLDIYLKTAREIAV